MTDTTQPGADNALDLDKLEALLSAATPGSWDYREADGISAIAHPLGWVLESGDEQECADKRFIVAAKNAMPALIALARRAAQPVRAKPFPTPDEGYERQWLKCRTCGHLQYYDYIPYSLSNPIMTTACGHGSGERDYGCDRISEDKARSAWVATHPSEPAVPAVGSAAPVSSDLSAAHHALFNAVRFLLTASVPVTRQQDECWPGLKSAFDACQQALAAVAAAKAAPVGGALVAMPDLLPPMGIRNDRDMLNYLMVAFDNEIGTCERCGHSEPTKNMDSAGFLREYLRAAPAGALVASDEDAAFEAWAVSSCDEEICKPRTIGGRSAGWVFSDRARTAWKARASLAAPTGSAAAPADLTKRRIEQIGWSLRMQAFENAVFRADHGQQMTSPEQDEYNQIVNFARAIASEVRAQFIATSQPIPTGEKA